MRYLILAAGMGKRMGSAGAAGPKCLIDIGGEPLIGRLLRQIRTHDPAADIHVVLGYRAETVAPVLAGCRIVINPFFDITGINASLVVRPRIVRAGADGDSWRRGALGRPGGEPPRRPSPNR